MAVKVPIPTQFTNLDVRDTLNAYGGSVGDVSSHYFEPRAKLNVWAGKKPTWNVNIPSSFEIYNQVGNISHLRFRHIVAGEPYRIADFIGYNPQATPCRLNRISVAPEVVKVNRQDMTIFFEFFTGEIDWRAFGATKLRVYLTIDGGIDTHNIIELPLNGIANNSIVNNAGQSVFQYTFVGTPGQSKRIGVAVSYSNDNGQLYVVDQPGTVMSMEQTVRYEAPYPTNIIYSYSGLWSSYSSYVQSMPKVPINTSSGEVYDTLSVPFRTTDQAIIGNFVRSGYIRFILPNSYGTILFKYSSQTPSQAATKILTYTLVGSFRSWPGVNNPNAYPITVSS